MSKKIIRNTILGIVFFTVGNLVASGDFSNIPLIAGLTAAGMLVIFLFRDKDK